MKENLPFLDQERLSVIFEHVYDIAGMGEEKIGFDDKKLNDLLKTLKSMQSFNYGHRPDDTRQLFELMDPIFNFDRNSEGTTLWLSMILAIKDLYGFSDNKLVGVIKQASVRK
jgi:hypothetical protein